MSRLFDGWIHLLASTCSITAASVPVWMGSFVIFFGAHTHAQEAFIDDAQRAVTLPAEVDRVFAAGPPAEVLLYTLVPEKLVGRNRTPSPAALEFTPPAFKNPVAILSLPNPNDDRSDGELLSLAPDIYVDYGDVTDDYITSVSNVQQRTGIPGIILDGAIDRIPTVYRRLGVALGVEARGEKLARHVERILAKYRGSLSRGEAPRVYLACSPDGTLPCSEGQRNGEMVRLLGAINVAGKTDGARPGHVTVTQIGEWNPDVIIASSAEAAVNILNDDAWRAVAAVAAGRVYAPPLLPFNWGAYPPSVNRLAGLMWLAYVPPGRPVDTELLADVRNFFTDFYHVTPSDEQLRRLLAADGR